MLKLGDIIRADKSNVHIGDWKQGKIPATAFPINKQRRLHLSSAWQWRVVEFDALSHHCRVLIRLNTDISYYSSILAIDCPGQIQIICHHEMHLSHRNWHCHFVAGNVLETMPGVLRDSDRMRVYETSPSKAKDVLFEVEETDAIAIAAARFRFAAPDERPAQGQLL